MPEKHLDALQARLAQRDIVSCPTGCVCTEMSMCGVQYPLQSNDIKGEAWAMSTLFISFDIHIRLRAVMGAGMVFALVLFIVLLLIIVFALIKQRRAHSSGYRPLN